MDGMGPGGCRSTTLLVVGCSPLHFTPPQQQQQPKAKKKEKLVSYFV